MWSLHPEVNVAFNEWYDGVMRSVKSQTEVPRVKKKTKV